MFPLWDAAIAPVLHAARARRVVEIGALRGETTVRMLEDLGPDAELHVIDPVPGFDPAEHERQFPGQYHFHEALSLEVLPTLGPMDAALIDGDHNWYTVYNELRLLAEGAQRNGTPLPVLVLHDVLWPYGRRDLYYAPEQIPEEFRQPYAQQGMRPGSRKLLQKGGLNPTMYNALEEGGPRNGVMTGVDDFVAEYGKPLRVVVLPIYFGLAIVVEEERLAQQPELTAVLDRLEGAEGRGDLLEVAEEVRLRAMIFQHNVFFQRSTQLERAIARHLRTVKAALLNEHYLDHEVRTEQLAAHITQRRPLVAAELRDPVRHDQVAFRRVTRDRLGPAGPDPVAATSFLPYAAMGRPQLDHLEAALDAVRSAEVPGDLVECGTGRGGGAIFMRAYLEAHEAPDRRVWVVDPFRATPEPDRAPSLGKGGVAAFQADLNLVRDGFERFGLLDDRVRFLQGVPADVLAVEDTGPIALLRIGRSVGAATGSLLERLAPRLSPGGVVAVDAPEGTEARRAVEEFRRTHAIDSPLVRIDGSAVAWTVDAVAPPPAELAAPTGRAAHPPLLAPAPAELLDLTVVVVVYNMRREAPRTLQALSRAYQEGVDGISYEVVVVENGSDDDQRLGAELVATFGPEFRYLDLGGDAAPSPVGALNRGIQAGRGRAFALMIDGAHVVTPGVVRFGLAGLDAYAPAIVATQQWYVGPGQQGEVMGSGYDEAYEDRLFEGIRWPHAGYRLFEIGHFVGDRDWLDGLWESNCMFVERSLLQQVGCFDERFSVAGGGYANLELYERLGSAPDINVVTMIGEGSFHQVHGGTTTNQVDAADRRARVFGYSQEYADLRGRAFKGPGKPIHYVGRIASEAARRSKPRRLSAKAFTDAAGVDDGLPTQPAPVPEELRGAFTDAVWRNLPWRSTSWLGRAIATAPTDLLAYQELVAGSRPDWIVEVGTGDGGRALFLASICELVGHGQVVSVDPEVLADPPVHARLRLHTGDPLDEATVGEVRDLVGGGRAVVVLGSLADRSTTVRQFHAYAPLVPEGSYVVVADTVVNGHPVWPAFGPGPAEAVKQILTADGGWAADPALEKYSLTFNPGGFLKRLGS